MPTPVEQILVNATDVIDIRLEPAVNALHSMALLARAEKYSAASQWLSHTTAAMSAEERERHRLIMNGFFYAITPSRSWPSFPLYVDHLAEQPVEALVDRMLTQYRAIPRMDGSDEAPPPPSAIIRSRESYLAFLRERFDPVHVDVDLESRAYDLLTEPSELKTLIVTHLRHMWEAYLADEWATVRPMLQDVVDAFRRLEYEAMDRAAVFEAVTDRRLAEIGWRSEIEAAEHLIFIPSAHIGPYIGLSTLEQGIALVFGARLPEGMADSAPDLTRAEILVRLNALADDTRLHILHLVGTTGEMRSQEIMERLGLSQSATSRSLSLLGAAGFLVARRCDGAKCYRLNPDRIADTLQAVSAFLQFDEAP